MNYWIIAKPETLLFCRKDLEQALLSQGFSLHKVHRIAHWDQLSLVLYADSPKVSKEQLQLQHIGRVQLLGPRGNLAELWELVVADPDDLEQGYEKLNRLKHAFRSTHWHTGLDIYFSKGDLRALYHYSYFHVPDPVLSVIQKEHALVRRYLHDEMDLI